jgi:ABC-type uncharacterized transport system ATPase subunit
VSLELTEILALADRVIVMSGGRIAGESPSGSIDLGQIGAWMTGEVSDHDIETVIV